MDSETNKKPPQDVGGQAGAGLNPQTGSILFLAGIFFLAFLGRTVTAPLLPVLEQDLGIGHAQAGSLFIYLTLGYFFSLLGSGFVAACLNHRRTIILAALAIGGALVVVGLSGSLWGLRCGLLAVGLASGLYLPSGVATLTTLVNPRHWGRALAIHDLAPNLSLVAAPALAGVLLGFISWRGVYAVSGGVALLMGLAFVLFGPRSQIRGQLPNLSTLSRLARTPSIWIMCALFSLASAGVSGVFNMLPLYLTAEHGMEVTTANLVIALSRISGLGMVFVSGWANDRLGSHRTMAIVLAASGALTVLLGLVSGTFLVVVIFLQAAVGICFFPPALAAVSRIGSFETRNLSVAIASATSILVGGGIISAGMGLLGEVGLFGTGLVATGVLILGGLVLLPRLTFTADVKD